MTIVTIACAAATLSAGASRAAAQPAAVVQTIELPGGVEGIRRAIGEYLRAS